MLEVLLQTDAAARVSQIIFVSDQTLHAPHLIDLEIVQALRRYVRSAVIPPERGDEALTDLIDLRLTRHPHLALLERVWEMRHGLTAYDAAYLALAEALGATLVTRDRAFGEIDTRVRVDVV